MDLTSKALKRFSKLIQPGNVLNIYGLNDKIKLLVPLVLHSNNLSYFNWTNNPVVAGINHQFSCISQLIGFEEGIFKITVSPPKSNEISSILNMCLSEFWDSVNSPTLKETKNATEKQAAKSVAS